MLSAIAIKDGKFSDMSLLHNHGDYIIKKQFTCTGDEKALLNCTFNERNVSYCTNSIARMKPAGVYCFGNSHG